jgi:poly-beta-1,6-N-acetyl-D-glucosamine synthase
MDFLGIKDSIILFFRIVDPFFLWYYSAVNLVYTITLFFGVFKIFKRKNEISVEDFTKIYQSNVLPQITFIVTIYNNGAKALKLTENILHLSYRYKNLILVNDGSSDDSLKLLQKAYDLIKIPKFYEDKIETKPIIGMYRSRKIPEIMVIDKEHGRKFDALNAAINVASDPLCVEVDSDTLIDNSNFEALIRPLLFDPELIAVGTSVRLSNGCSQKYNRPLA